MSCSISCFDWLIKVLNYHSDIFRRFHDNFCTKIYYENNFCMK